MQTEGNALLSRLSTVFSVKINANNVLVFNEEGALSVANDGSLVYLANGATLVDQSGKPIYSPVANNASIAPVFVEQNDISIALSPYFFSRYNRRPFWFRFKNRQT